MAKAMTVALPTRTIVQGSVSPSRVETWAGYSLTLVPKLKCRMSSRYATYWCQSEPGCPTPSNASIARKAEGCRLGNLAMMLLTALPGIRRGMKKLRVSATHAATA